MRRIGLFAFGITTSVLVPTALHLVDAGPTQVAKLMAPDASSLTIDGTKIDVSVDTSITDPGNEVKVKLASTGGQRTTLAVLVLEARGSGGSRVDSPPERIARRAVTLAPNASKELAFTLRGFRGREMDGVDFYGHYTILVMTPAAADNFEKLRKKAAAANPMSEAGDPDGSYGTFETNWESIGQTPSDTDQKSPFGEPGTIARLDVRTRPSDSPVTIKAPSTHKVDDTFAITVTVKNPSPRRHSDIKLELSAKPEMLGDAYLGLGDDMVTIDDATRDGIELAPHQTKKFTFKVTAKAAGTLGLFARTNCGSCEWKDQGQSDVALEAVDITDKSGERPTRSAAAGGAEVNEAPAVVGAR